ncbi:MAG TPA: ABC transporter substrate-binding protein [Actinophytocola sp.]|uniref:peptide ABC transporter substrate-binding protein n=1 Tax=Actinophytocola sp. TaxID=1872138 RepID=UPI002DFD5A3B|nr:ABC transporter substrate-binding protein [Actinophytocola sp.]
MSTKSVWLRAAVGLTVAGLALAGCAKKENTGTSGGNQGGNNAQPTAGWPETAEVKIQPGKPGGTFRQGLTEPTAIDPVNAQESEGINIAQYIFTGLIKVDPDGATKEGAATKWEPNNDCSEWTFTLKAGAKFTNGEEVTSQSFKFAWEREAAKASASEVAYHMEPIKGFKELQDGTATTFSGVDASDPGKLKVTLTDPDCEFYLRTYHTVFAPLPKVAGAGDNKAFNDMPLGNGPFKMAGPWQHDKGIKLVRNDDYAYGQKAYLDAVEFTIVPNGNNDEYDGFNNGTFDWARIPVPALTKARSDNEPKSQWIRKNTNGINYLLPMLHEKPLDNVKARQAISLALDRGAVAEGVFKGSQIPATSFVPGVFKKAYQAGVCGFCKFDLEQAKKLAQEAGLTPGTELNMQFNSGGGHEEYMAAYKQQLEKNLGLKVNLTAVQFKDLLNNEQAPHATGLYRAAWGADYATPGNFLAPLLSCKATGLDDPSDLSKPVVGDNRARYCNKQFDDLLNKAKASKSEDERTKLYQQAEKIAIGDDLALIPTFVRTQNRLCNTAKFINCRMDFNENADISVISIK